MRPTLASIQSPGPAPRWNPWPAAVVGFLVFFFGATIGLVTIAVRQPADLVSRDYYDKEIQFQSQIDRVSRARALGPGLSVSYDAAAGALKVVIPTDAARGSANGEIRLYRPSDPGLDRSFPLNADAKGVQIVQAPDLATGLWRVKVDWSDGSGSYSDAGAFNAPGGR
jgi:hypothetical protein